ncbi:hypothetical protein ACFXOI_09035, partial [Streptomyces bacillaris]
MTKKTRVRVARIAAGAVIAAGASLTAAGAAQALEIGVDTGLGDSGLSAEVSIQNEEDNPAGGVDQGGTSEGGEQQGGASEGNQGGGDANGGGD